MKILKQFEQTLNPEQIASWLCWIQDNCIYNCSCVTCIFKESPVKNDIFCQVKEIYRGTHPNKRGPWPNCWRLPFHRTHAVKPDNLNFLYKIRWDDSGNPIPELKEVPNENIKTV